jgi:hypothetical protein
MKIETILTKIKKHERERKKTLTRAEKNKKKNKK